MKIFEWVRETFKHPEIARKFWVAAAGLFGYVLLAFGVNIPEDQLEHIVTLLFLLTAGGVWAVPNEK